MNPKQKNLALLFEKTRYSNTKNRVAFYQGSYISQTRFYADVQQLSASLCQLKQHKFALYFEQAYPFCVCLFALLHCGKKVWIAANNKPAIAEQLTLQDCILLGDWNGSETVIESNKVDEFKLKPLNLNKAELTLFTSGSTGQAKEIHKTLQQLQTEIDVLESCWGELLDNAQVLATVSHQHIYGLLFGILWPLAAGRCFYSEMFLSPEPLLKAAENISAYWVASPAQLKRLDELTSWRQLSRLKALFSSGGVLPIAATKQIYQNSQHKVLEIYGSSETGGIAWRQSVDHTLWTTFEGVDISIDQLGNHYLSSTYLVGKKAYKMDDRLKLLKNKQFELLGRLDRIVKIEEKRLSLDELESALKGVEWIEQCYSLLIAAKRDKIAVVLVLTPSGEAFLQQQGRADFIKQVRKQLMSHFETVVLPKKWLFINTLPLTPQCKINQQLLIQLLSLDPLYSPQILSCNYQAQSIALQCRISLGLLYFNGHFPEQPILPGVTQLAWAEQLAKIFFNISLPFLRMEVVKFKKIIEPNMLVDIHLSWKPETGKLYFEITSGSYSHSSGRMVYGESP
ncbi:MAG: AMP-binding protein [Methylococcales bacterium]